MQCGYREAWVSVVVVREVVELISRLELFKTKLISSPASVIFYLTLTLLPTNNAMFKFSVVC